MNLPDFSWSSTREFVGQGIMLAVPLCFPGQSVPPPAGETAINAIAIDPEGTVYLGTAGAKAHVMGAVLHQDAGIVFDLGVIPGASAISALVPTSEGVLVLATGPAGGSLWTLPRFGARFLIQEWSLRRAAPTKVADILPGKGVAHAVVTADGRTLLGVTDKSGEVFRTDVATGTTDIVGQLDASGRYSRRVILDNAGRLWGSCGLGQIWSYEPQTSLWKRPVRIPAAAGRAQHTQASAWALDAFTGQIYGGTRPDGFLFRLDPATGQVTPLGKPSRVDTISCLTVGNDGRVFGMTGEDDDMGHLFVYDAAAGSLRDLGVPVSTLSVRHYGIHFASAATGRYGEMYFGQSERVNHLWLYFPPVPPRAAAMA
jgi:outer membrane protein assembly factor BamB